MRVVRADKRDHESILSWLEREYNETLGDGFWRNRRVIQRSFEHRDLWVIRNDDEAVAFQVGNYAAEIMCVRQDLQRQGFGKKLFSAALARAKRANVNVLSGECSPETSLEFWQGLGFERYYDLRRSGDILVRRIIERRFKLPKGKTSAAVEIEFYPQEAPYREGIPSISTHRPKAVLLDDGEVLLEKRIIGIRQDDGGDLVVRIKIDGVERCFCKAKHIEAIALGVEYDRVGDNFYLDVVKRVNA